LVLLEQLNSSLCLQALSSRSIFVKKLWAAKSLAYVDTILLDKTGTLTYNRRRLKSVWTPPAVRGGDADVSMKSEGTLVDGKRYQRLFMNSVGGRPALRRARTPDVQGVWRLS
jgi:magnesium-transporting ATPase (P-type)